MVSIQHASDEPLITTVVVSYNTRELLQNCLEELIKAARDICPMKIIVVDNASRDGSADMVTQAFPMAQLIRSGDNLGFAAANNVAFRYVQSPFTLLLNPDAIVMPNALEQSINRMVQQPRAGLVGGRLLGSDGAPVPSARSFPSLQTDLLTLLGFSAGLAKPKHGTATPANKLHPNHALPVDWVPGAFCMVRTQALVESKGFDERFFLYFEEVDLCRRLWAKNWQVWYDPGICVKHIGGASASSVDAEKNAHIGSQLMSWYMRSALLYYRKHHGYSAALGSAMLEISWHGLRALKNRWWSSAPDKAGAAQKHHESKTLQRLMRQAWRDTAGGTQSPARPW